MSIALSRVNPGWTLAQNWASLSLETLTGYSLPTYYPVNQTTERQDSHLINSPELAINSATRQPGQQHEKGETLGGGIKVRGARGHSTQSHVHKYRVVHWNFPIYIFSIFLSLLYDIGYPVHWVNLATAYWVNRGWRLFVSTRSRKDSWCK